MSLRTLSMRIQPSLELGAHFIRRAAVLHRASVARRQVPLESLKDAITFFDLPTDLVEALRAAAHALELRDRDYMRRLLSERSLRLLADQPVEPLRPLPPVSRLEVDTPEIEQMISGLKPGHRQLIEVPNELIEGLEKKAQELGGLTLPAAIVAIAEDHFSWLSLDPLQVEVLKGEAASLGINPRDYMRAVFAQEGLRLRIEALKGEADEEGAD